MANGPSPLIFQPPAAKKNAISVNSTHPIILSTLNAKYIHASLGLRYLMANMGDLASATRLAEFTINQRPIDIVEKLLGQNPSIIGFGVYIWNIRETTDVIDLIKTVAPQVTIVIGGPEVSYEFEGEHIFQLCDFLIVGQADFVFADLCTTLSSGSLPATKVIVAPTPSVKDLKLPYTLYGKDDIANRVIYVEASRGCPFKCEFCLSALDKTAYPVELKLFLDQLQNLYDRGARQFKFVDRTFNLKAATSVSILRFFLERMDKSLFVHFEVIPDKLPDVLKTAIKEFPAGTLQFEVGIQSFNTDVQKTINRKQNNQRSIENMRWLRNHSGAYIHADLIFGLPGESLESFAIGFNTLVDLNPQEIQVGILKRLRGSPIIRHTDNFDMQYAPLAPYTLLASSEIDFATMQRMQRFARYWDLIANSGRFSHTLPVLLGELPFERFMLITDDLFRRSGQTHKISLVRLIDMVFDSATGLKLCNSETLQQSLLNDYSQSGEKKPPACLKEFTRSRKNHATDKHFSPTRQSRHLKNSVTTTSEQ